MIEKYSTVKVNNKVLEIMSDLTYIREKIAEFVENPNPEIATEIENVFSKMGLDHEALSNSVIALVKNIINEDKEEFDVVQEENGTRLN